MHRLSFRALLLGGLAVGLLAGPGRASAGEIDDLKTQIQMLMQKVDKLDKQQTMQKKQIEAKAPLPENVVTGGDFPGSFKLPGSDTSVKLGGYVKADFIYDIAQKGGAAQGVPGADNGTNLDTGHYQAHARQSRFSIETRTATDYGTAKTFLELDLFGSSGTESFTNAHNPRVRHAYGSLGPVLAGQTWTTFNSVAAYPETIDFEGPAGESFLRQVQIRYTGAVNDKLTIEAALENPETLVSTQAAGYTAGRDRYPDAVLKGTYKDKWGFLSLSGVGRRLYVDNGATNDSQFGWGLGLGGRYNTFGKDNFRFQLSGGDGIGRYILESGKTGVFVDGNGNIDNTTAYGGFLAYQHWWTGKLRSNAVLGATHQDNPSVASTTTATTDVQSAHVNLVWSPTAKTNFGIEYSLFDAERETGAGGQFSRVQVGLQYIF